MAAVADIDGFVDLQVAADDTRSIGLAVSKNGIDDWYLHIHQAPTSDNTTG